jgi:hypothetical protein
MTPWVSQDEMWESVRQREGGFLGQRLLGGGRGERGDSTLRSFELF